MLTFEGNKGVECCDGLTRRDFLRAGAAGAGAVGLTLADLCRADAANGKGDRNCIVLFLVGGPSQLDTWDLKPDAPADIHGPFKPIRTSVPGIEIGEHFPLMAKRADRFALVRSVFHQAAPVHETGHQLMQTGRLFRSGQEYPHYGAVVSKLSGAPSIIVPEPIGNTGVSVSHGQGAGYLGDDHEPFIVRGDPNAASYTAQIDRVHRAADTAARPDADQRAFDLLFSAPAKQALDIDSERTDLRARYGRNTFGQSCLLARRLVESGVRLVTVNMFDTVFNEVTWDCHADGGALASNLDDYRDTLGPMFDKAYTALLDDLESRGLLDNTMVVAMGEFGRTPQLNPRGGRDHWPGVWTVLFAGGGVRGGRVIGASDRHGAEPKDRPVTPAEIAASVYRGLGVDPHTRLAGPDSRPQPLVDAEPIHELFGG
jgi:uncharacterized protein (DUF1501 family)